MSIYKRYNNFKLGGMIFAKILYVVQWYVTRMLDGQKKNKQKIPGVYAHQKKSKDLQLNAAYGIATDIFTFITVLKYKHIAYLLE